MALLTMTMTGKADRFSNIDYKLLKLFIDISDQSFTGYSIKIQKAIFI
jgi:hypothetical protein